MKRKDYIKILYDHLSVKVDEETDKQMYDKNNVIIEKKMTIDVNKII